jgi:hypothetical protein
MAARVVVYGELKMFISRSMFQGSVLISEAAASSGPWTDDCN